jgi:cell division control protein 11
MPFAIVGSEEEVEIDGEPVRARVYPWGVVEVDNPKHSDFSRLRGALLAYGFRILLAPVQCR